METVGSRGAKSGQHLALECGIAGARQNIAAYALRRCRIGLIRNITPSTALVADISF